MLEPGEQNVTQDSHRSGARRASAIVAAACCLLGLTACGSQTLDNSNVVRLIRHLVTTQEGLSVRAVACPASIPVDKGAVSYCTVTLTNHHTLRWSITQTDSKADVQLRQTEMSADAIETYVDSHLAAKGSKLATVCPQHEPAVVGNTFDCKSSDRAGHRATVKITVRSANGSFSVQVLGTG